MISLIFKPCITFTFSVLLLSPFHIIKAEPGVYVSGYVNKSTGFGVYRLEGNKKEIIASNNNLTIKKIKAGSYSNNIRLLSLLDSKLYFYNDQDKAISYINLTSKKTTPVFPCSPFRHCQTKDDQIIFITCETNDVYLLQFYKQKTELKYLGSGYSFASFGFELDTYILIKNKTKDVYFLDLKKSKKLMKNQSLKTTYKIFQVEKDLFFVINPKPIKFQLVNSKGKVFYELKDEWATGFSIHQNKICYLTDLERDSSIINGLVKIKIWDYKSGKTRTLSEKGNHLYEGIIIDNSIKKIK
jgi:hypothetical protein